MIMVLYRGADFRIVVSCDALDETSLCSLTAFSHTLSVVKLHYSQVHIFLRQDLTTISHNGGGKLVHFCNGHYAQALICN